MVLWKNPLGFYKTLNLNRRFLFNCRHHPRFRIEKAPNSLLVSRHFLAPVTTKKRAKTSASARRRRRRRRRFSLVVSFFFLVGERERERGIYTHTHDDDESFSRFKSVPFFSRSLSRDTRIFTLISLLKVVVVVALPSARIVFSPSQTHAQRERVCE